MEESQKLAYTLKNNYLFLALMNSHHDTLKMLICSLLGMQLEDIVSLEIRNPIEVGKAVGDKTFILDVAVLLNNNTYLNIELQVVDSNNWPERSLGYLCRTYDNLNGGEDYIETKPAIHVSILDFTLFEDCPEFFAAYRLLNTKNHHEYTSKFQLYVLDLRRSDLATDADRANKLDVWTRIFQAKTWGDLMEIAAEYNEFQSTVEQINRLSADEQVRLQCEARERVMNHERAMNKKLTKQETMIAKQDARLAEQNAQIAEQDAKLAEQNTQIAEQDAKLAEQDAKLAEQDAKLTEQENEIVRLQEELARLRGEHS